MRHPELLIIAFVVLSWIARTIIKFVKWSVNQVKTAGITPSPIQQAIAEASRQQTAPSPPPRSQAALRPPSGLRPLPRRPDAGGPAVPVEATSRDFDRSEQELFAAEPSPLDTPLRSVPSAADAAGFRLFDSKDDIVRAIILKEVLGPPLSKRIAPQ